ncbi:MAG: type II toxin-antitoxin system VapC family toxin [Alphaproteobacteria bacterium]
MIVVDASVAVKWVLPEFGSPRAEAIMEGDDVLTAPDILRIEVAGAVVRRVRTVAMPPEEARVLVASWTRALDRNVVALVPSVPLLDDASHLAIEMRHTLQDCLYLALARRNDALLVTADRRFAERSAAHHEKIELIASD